MKEFQNVLLMNQVKQDMEIKHKNEKIGISITFAYPNMGRKFFLFLSFENTELLWTLSELKMDLKHCNAKTNELDGNYASYKLFKTFKSHPNLAIAL